jgi:AraC family transcriptional regulator of adaptative response / DNA-3-methyladenine glycosylase II
MRRTATGPKSRRASNTSWTNSPGLAMDIDVRKRRAGCRRRADNGAMLLDDDQCYRALRTHDARFDGRFFVGVGSTRIYCRPVCTARTPLKRNCSFFASAAAAEAKGYRPCLRCRPELAPGYAAVDANRRLAQSAAGLIEDGRLADASLEALAAALGVTDRHLRRVFQQEFGVSPVEYAQTQRLLLAKRLLTDSALPVIDVAMASGFASLRRFNDLFRTRYRMTPGQLRRDAAHGSPAERMVFEIAYRPPYDWESMHAFLARRAVAGVELADSRSYSRTIRVAHRQRTFAGFICVAAAPRKSALRVSVSPSLAPALPAVLSRVKQLFDVAAHPDEIAQALGALASSRPGLRLPGAVDGFELAVRAILGQQVTVVAATRIAARLAEKFGEPLETPVAGLSRLFPTAEVLAAADPSQVAAAGIISTRAKAIVALATEVASGRLRLDPSADVAATLEALEALPGVGAWTAQYIAMRALAWPDAFPHPDVALIKAMEAGKPREALAASEAWRPWRAYAVIHLWKSLEGK